MPPPGATAAAAAAGVGEGVGVGVDVLNFKAKLHDLLQITLGQGFGFGNSCEQLASLIDWVVSRLAVHRLDLDLDNHVDLLMPCGRLL